ncbi:DUF2971 domain-containing protein [Bradyrhizobium sp.]|uniref:DUF2971 domain-containing protein n=1 Tax=Bradyrhizobium sp. TaxID=376 RepID=UPI003C74B70B
MTARSRPDHWAHDRDYFYKYMNSSAAKAVLANRTLKWSPASAFNDPFDMQFDLHLDFNADELVGLCKQDIEEILLGNRDFEPRIGLGNVLARLQAIAPRMSAAELDQFIEDSLRLAIKNMPIDMPAMHDQLRKHFGTYKVLCLSETNDSLLMWSHYAERHRGVVFRFACLEETDSSWTVARPINYTEKMPRFVNQEELRGLLTGQTDLRRESIAERTIFSKALDWQYEKEWRVYFPSKDAGDEFLNFHAQELSAVYFGCKVEDADRNAIIALSRAINPTVEIFSARKSGREFAIEFDRFATPT